MIRQQTTLSIADKLQERQPQGASRQITSFREIEVVDREDEKLVDHEIAQVVLSSSSLSSWLEYRRWFKKKSNVIVEFLLEGCSDCVIITKSPYSSTEK